MLYDEFMGDLAKAAKQVCRLKQDTLYLTADQTIEFFSRHKLLTAYGVSVSCYEGELVDLDLPSFPLPVRTNTVEEYSYGGVNVVPAYQYHSIVNYFLSRQDTNLIPLGMRT